ncbi:MAG: catechol 2,3-dioxygenase-like lactoylglutathione lyase family enzyme [Bermanella sp.]
MSSVREEFEMTLGKIIGLQHLAINVTDLDAAKTFYGELLGLPELPRPASVAAQFRSLWYLLGNAELHVVENPDFQPVKSPLGPHFAVACDDFAKASKRYAGSGAPVMFGPGKGADGIERIVLKDPTGNVVEVIDLPLHRAD